jgi:hypothetical protein
VINGATVELPGLLLDPWLFGSCAGNLGVAEQMGPERFKSTSRKKMGMRTTKCNLISKAKTLYTAGICM